jgi:hypothetical protein
MRLACLIPPLGGDIMINMTHQRIGPAETEESEEKFETEGSKGNKGLSKRSDINYITASC